MLTSIYVAPPPPKPLQKDCRFRLNGPAAWFRRNPSHGIRTVRCSPGFAVRDRCHCCLKQQFQIALQPWGLAPSSAPDCCQRLASYLWHQAAKSTSFPRLSSVRRACTPTLSSPRPASSLPACEWARGLRSGLMLEWVGALPTDGSISDLQRCSFWLLAEVKTQQEV